VNEHLFRSRDDRMIAGVAGGLAELWDADPSIVRIVWAMLVVLTGGLALVVYVVMAIVVPAADAWGSASSGPPPAPAPAFPPPTTRPAETATSETTATTVSSVTSTSGAPPTSAAPPTTAQPLVTPAPEPGAMWAAPPVDAGRAARADARAARRAARAERRSSGSGLSGSMIGGLILVGIGVFFLAREWLPRFSLDWFWPSMLILLGIVLLVAALGRKPRDPGTSA
jgi:phage shock protein C